MILKKAGRIRKKHEETGRNGKKQEETGRDGKRRTETERDGTRQKETGRDGKKFLLFEGGGEPVLKKLESKKFLDSVV